VLLMPLIRSMSLLLWTKLLPCPPERDLMTLLTRCYLSSISHKVCSTLSADSSRPRKRRKVVPPTQFTTLNSKSKAVSLDTSTVCTTNTSTLTTSKYFCEVAQPGKSWVPSYFPSENLFTHNYMPTFPSYHQDLFNDLIGFIANAKPILIQGTALRISVSCSPVAHTDSHCRRCFR
jgi:hypothetical protein